MPKTPEDYQPSPEKQAKIKEEGTISDSELIKGDANPALENTTKEGVMDWKERIPDRFTIVVKPGEKKMEVYTSIEAGLRAQLLETAELAVRATNSPEELRVLSALKEGSPLTAEEASYYATSWEGKGDSVNPDIACLVKARLALDQVPLRMERGNRKGGPLGAVEINAVKSLLCSVFNDIRYTRKRLRLPE
mgnify:CR=1 FL=1